MSDNHSLPGAVLPAVLTPVREDLAIDHDAFAEHCRWLLAHGCDGLAPMGTTGEANSFSVDERMEALERLVQAGVPATRMIVGVGCCAIPDTVALARHAVDLGVGGVLALPPFYYKNVSNDGLYAAYDQVIQRVGDRRLKLYLYHFPQMSGVPLSRELIVRLHESYPDSVVGLKDSSGDWDNMKAVCQRLPRFRVYAGTERYLLPVLRAGGAGTISSTVNVTCALAAQVYEKRESPAADALQERLTAVRDAIERRPPAIPALKRLTAERTGRAGWRYARPPHLPLPEARFAEVRAALDRLEFALP